MIHRLQIVAHLFDAGHAGKHGQHTGQRRRKAERPRSGRSFRILLTEQLRYVGGRRRQIAAAHRLHDHNGHAVPARDLIALAGLDLFILPIDVIDLQLHKFRFWMPRQNRIQLIRGIVEGKADVANLALRLLFEDKAPQIQIFIHRRAMIAQIVQQIEIKIARARALQRYIEHPSRFFRGLFGKQRKLGRQIEAVARMALHHGLAHRDLVRAVAIGICRIKVGIAVRHEFIHHPAGLFQIDRIARHRQAHHAKAQLRHRFYEFLVHCFLLSTHSYINSSTVRTVRQARRFGSIRDVRTVAFAPQNHQPEPHRAYSPAMQRACGSAIGATGDHSGSFSRRPQRSHRSFPERACSAVSGCISSRSPVLLLINMGL